jgi:hypothetical protein
VGRRSLEVEQEEVGDSSSNEKEEVEEMESFWVRQCLEVGGGEVAADEEEDANVEVDVEAAIEARVSSISLSRSS